MNASDIILGPIISEKSMDAASKGKFTFRVSKNATKKDIKKAIEEKFKVNVTKIGTTIVKDRKKRMGAKRIEAFKNDYKKALLTLKEGQKIPIFDVGTKE